MPLVTITCSADYYPPDSDMERFTDTMMKAVGLAQELPSLIVTEAGEQMHLDEGTRPADVQVDIQRFHRFAVNVTDLWVRVELTEAEMPVEHRHEARDALIAIITTWIDTAGLRLTWALDLFVSGGGYGCISDDMGVPQKSW